MNGKLDATPLGQCGFDLLDNRLRLPAGLGDLPLYPEEDEWYSVLGPWKGTTDNPDDVNQDDPEANPDVPIPPVNPPRNARPDPALIYCEYPKCSGNSGPHSRAPAQLICLAPGCSSPGTFKTKQALTRHYQSKHLDTRVDCTVPGCLYVGDRGFKRVDNLHAHLLTRHGISRAKPAYGN